MKLTIQIVAYNSLKFLPGCLASLKGQTFKDFDILVVDNHSTDGTGEFLREKYPGIYVFRNLKNLGFARSHNQGFSLKKSEYVLVLNPDIVLEPDFLEKLIKGADKKKKGFSFSPKLLKIKTGNEDLGEKIKTNIIDSTGLKIYPSGQVKDRGEGEEDKGQYDKKTEIFGVSGACALYQRDLLKKVGFFDDDFFAYKEDADLAWRAQLFGFSSYYIPEAKAYHYRQAPKERRLFQSQFVAFYSFRNGLFLLLKNVHWQNFFLYFPLIFAYQMTKKFYLLFKAPETSFKAKLSFLQYLSAMYRKREKIFKRAKITAKQFRRKFFSH
ncbi:glycosyltransferase family 2 protein [bacterium (Candidatus Moisslbacteria) CG12_big_fil_rev_8_21_14_0_65_36_11]|nr:glycosyltransferase family 2 protein [Candidatus Kuenenbacteria bacterium]OIP76890.1 MAG: hypothetical protein AUK09_00855 [Parcubacteria group bacterium CG2_30_36_38]PIV45908.1 MAG: glycosyltransferase family 2 protein [bacterium (Candidatus Moisslbacteria) CG02_land_8_20_14_3_00_36_53]PIW67978.1 MAG: glycosyltransferase family 2 protein [bacterium (Candidatus Moisslbacteria) CG12_big_fil_rev_8_21_14_0_65_36_11]PIZ90174.1 MAG: glycosyltransferase family 2 protein [bacterium (Candidatus Mois